MASCHIFLYCAFILGVYGCGPLGFVLMSSHAQTSSRSLVSSSIIRNCYQNTTAFLRYRRQPMQIENLIAIIQKIEHKNPLWDMRRIARTIVKGFQFDGMKFDGNARPELAYSQTTAESIKTSIVHRILPSPDSTFEEGVLDNDERCALHWMISHSMNATMRDDEEIERYGYRMGNLRAKRSAPGPGMLDLESDNEPERAKRVVRQAVERTTRWPVETGVVQTKWGSISAGRMIAGISAGLEPLTESVSYVPMSSDGAYRGYTPTNTGTGNRNPSTGTGSNYPNTGTGGSYPNTGAGSSYPNTGTGGNYPSSGAGSSYPNTNTGTGGSYPSRPGSSGSYPNNNNNPVNPFGGRKKRQVSISFEAMENLYAATLAGDIGQAAILNAKFSPYIQNKQPPSGEWNDTICPREFVLSAQPDPTQDTSHEHDTWTYMTAAEVRGGLDGAILGAKIFDWDRLNVIKLSEVLKMYYSDQGYANEPTFRACDRSSIYTSVIQTTKLFEQGKSFAYVFNLDYKQMPINEETASAFIENVQLATNRLTSYASNLQSIDPPCVRRIPSYGSGEIPEREKYTQPKSTVYAVLDHGVTSREALVAQQRFVGKLAYELDVSVHGSRLGLIDGRGGQILISPNWTDNAAVLACRITDQEQYLQTQDLVSTLRTIKSEIQRVRDIEHRTEYRIGVGNGIVILVFVQSTKLPENRRDDIRGVIQEFENDFGDVHVIFTSSVLSENDFNGFTLNEPNYDFIRIRGSQNITDDTTLFLEEFVKRTHARLFYPRCNQVEYDQSEEYTIANDIFLTPGTIQFYKISPTYFYSYNDLRLRFSSDRGRVRVCTSRDQRYPTSSMNDMECYDTSGTYVEPGSNGKDVELIWNKPCNKNKRDGCAPIYLSITPTIVNTGGAAGVDCSTYGCERPDQVRVTWSHWNMRCGAIKTALSSFTMLITIFLSVFSFYKSV